MYHISYHKFIGKCNDGFKCKVCYFKHLDRDEMLEHVKKKHRNDRLYNGIDGQNLTHVAGKRIRIISISKKLCEYCSEEFKSNDWHMEKLCQDSCKLYSEFIEIVTNHDQPKNSSANYVVITRIKEGKKYTNILEQIIQKKLIQRDLRLQTITKKIRRWTNI